MSPQRVLLPLLLGSASSQSCTQLAAQTDEKPNVILIMADDLGWGDTGFNGNSIIKTPHLDRMATDGIKFNRFYSASALSSPTRASVLTGRNPFRMGVFSANVGVLRDEEVTLPELLKGEGYSTGHFGKWHLGSLSITVKDGNRGGAHNLKEYNPPKRHGYDQAFVSESKVPTWDPMRRPLEVDHNGWSALVDGEPYEHYGTYYWDIDDKMITENLDGDDSRVIMDRVIPFIDHSVENKSPFLAVVWFHTPHKPCVAGAEYAAMYSEYDVEMQNYGGCITAMDDQIGRLRAFLSEQNIDDNTIIYFCSDNGPERDSPGSAGEFRDRKRSLHEGGVRVPSLMVWPAKVDGGQVSESPASTMDYLPTIASIVGVDSDKMLYEIDGEDLSPIIFEQAKGRVKPITLCLEDQISLSNDTHKLYINGNSEMLYDIVADPYEQTPIVDCTISKVLKDGMKINFHSIINSYEGGEYGRESFDKLDQGFDFISKYPEELRDR